MKLPETLRPTESLSDGDFPGWVREHGAALVESYHEGWERPWRALDGQGWDELRRECGANVNVAVMETGRCREFATRYGLEIIPALLVFQNGEVIARFTGKVRVHEVIAALKSAAARARTLEVDLAELETAAAVARQSFANRESLVGAAMCEIPSAMPETLERAEPPAPRRPRQKSRLDKATQRASLRAGPGSYLSPRPKYRFAY